jgi:hypothetical protein
LSGTILEFWLWDRFAEIFAEIQRSNMSKVCNSLEEAEATVMYYKLHRDTESYIIPKWNQYLVHRKEDNKIIKSINYSPADIKKFL